MKINSISGFSEAYTESIEGRKRRPKANERSNKRAEKKEKRKEKRADKKASGKGLFKGVKKVALSVPRGSFLALVRLNARGLATKLFNAPKDKAERIWKALGGNPAKLYAAVAVGSKKKAFLGEKASVQTTEGIGEPVTLVTVGTLLASAGAVIAAFAPILKMIDKNKGTKGGESTEEILKETEEAGGDLTIPDGEVSDGEAGSGKESKKGGLGLDIDFTSPTTLLVGAGLAFGAYKVLSK